MVPLAVDRRRSARRSARPGAGRDRARARRAGGARGRPIRARPIASIACSPPLRVAAACRRRSSSRGNSPEDLRHPLRHLAGRPLGEGAHPEVLLDGHLREDAAPLRHHRDPAADDPRSSSGRRSARRRRRSSPPRAGRSRGSSGSAWSCRRRSGRRRQAISPARSSTETCRSIGRAVAGRDRAELKQPRRRDRRSHCARRLPRARPGRPRAPPRGRRHLGEGALGDLPPVVEGDHAPAHALDHEHVVLDDHDAEPGHLSRTTWRSFISSTVSAGLIPAEGSSRSRSCGREASARQISTRRRSICGQGLDAVEAAVEQVRVEEAEQVGGPPDGLAHLGEEPAPPEDRVEQPGPDLGVHADQDVVEDRQAAGTGGSTGRCGRSPGGRSRGPRALAARAPEAHRTRSPAPARSPR